ncbi:LOW QUALITY PROTEIN: hypothetical protein CFC21_028126 [Triticum aestivum]|uniref:At1g61320/AtMIF1 LRR domain-containing protein n=2 Tax=Triticum aestivum TaxID=4565 RepID=A0A3B6D776_WHEAT|nr:LOW QUALITY PROTEIN: hypothetical protein CFC21_028126 [Triticum aestivum]
MDDIFFLLQKGVEDRLSALTDDILISILEKVDVATAARSSVLSTRWRNLSWLLSDPKFHATDFLSAPCGGAARHIDQAMASLARATGSFLAQPRRERTVKQLCLELYLTGNYSRDIGLLVSSTIDSEMVKDLELAILTEKEPKDSKHEVMVQQAREVNGFFSAFSSVLRCLTRLQLHNVRFADQDMNHLLFDCCKQLLHLSLNHCNTEDYSVWKIDAPNSNLRVLEVYFFQIKRAEVLCLPKLERVLWQSWFSCEAPLSFGYVPSLKELSLVSNATLRHLDFSLSQILHGATNTNALTLNFQGEKLWMEPEGKQLCTAFNKLRKLSIHGIFIKFDLLWTLNLLEAPPSVVIFDVEMFEHPCWESNKTRISYGAQRVKPSWKMPGFTSYNKWQLKEFQLLVLGPLEQHFLFVSTIMGRAPDLKTVLLTDGKYPCKDCDAMVPIPPPIGGFFPTYRDGQEAIAKQLRERVRSLAQIIFRSGSTYHSRAAQSCIY